MRGLSILFEKSSLIFQMDENMSHTLQKLSNIKKTFYGGDYISILSKINPQHSAINFSKIQLHFFYIYIYVWISISFQAPKQCNNRKLNSERAIQKSRIDSVQKEEKKFWREIRNLVPLAISGQLASFSTPVYCTVSAFNASTICIIFSRKSRESLILCE